MNKFFDKVLRFANDLAADHYNKGGRKSGKSYGDTVKKDSNVVDIKSRGRKESKSDEGMTDFSGGAGI